jgi:acetyl esterase/lipase
VLNALTPDDTFQRTAGIAYGEDPRQKLDVYVPRQPLEGAPVVVFFYGGSWNSGDRGDYALSARRWRRGDRRGAGGLSAVPASALSAVS